MRASIVGRRILHFACHGLADNEHGNLFGALAFSSASQTTSTEDDGYLTLNEIYGLDLSATELAVLSACQTNYGPQQKGEGVWALSRGFLVAGARRVVASNWVVDDRAGLALTNLHVVEAMWRRLSFRMEQTDKGFRIHGGVFVDFIAESGATRTNRCRVVAARVPSHDGPGFERLDAAGFFFPEDKRPRMLANLDNLFRRMDLGDADVRTLHGVVRALAGSAGG